MTERLAADISRDLRARGPWPSERLLAEAADKLDGLIALLAEAETARDDYATRLKATDRAYAAAARERDEARAKAVDGGEWQWGVRTTWDDETITDGWYRDEAAARRVAAPSPARNQVIRRRVGPVEPVTDDGAEPSATDPNDVRKFCVLCRSGEHTHDGSGT